MKVVTKSLGVLVSLALISALGFMVANPRAVQDWWALRGYEPSPRIAEIVTATAMTEDAKKIFYVYDPQVEDSTTFNLHCTIREVSIVLGCYNGISIYVFNVSDPRLAGVQEVTAAHEMLHAAYDRLDDDERNRVDTMTKAQFQKLANERIQNTVKAYRERDESVVPNELHSILATEVRILDPELEAYYARYFSDRTKVVDLSESYEQVFNELKAKVERLDAELILLKAQIDALEQDLGARSDSIYNQKNELDRLSASNNVAAYNAGVPTYNQSVQSYNDDLAIYRSLISEYNQKVAIRNESTVEQNNLIDSLSSNADEL